MLFSDLPPLLQCGLSFHPQATLLRQTLQRAGDCSRGAQRVLRYGDMEYVMLHLIFIYLMPGEGQIVILEYQDVTYSLYFSLSTLLAR